MVEIGCNAPPPQKGTSELKNKPIPLIELKNKPIPLIEFLFGRITNAYVELIGPPFFFRSYVNHLWNADGEAMYLIC